MTHATKNDEETTQKEEEGPFFVVFASKKRKGNVSVHRMFLNDALDDYFVVNGSITEDYNYQTSWLAKVFDLVFPDTVGNQAFSYTQWSSGTSFVRLFDKNHQKGVTKAFLETTDPMPGSRPNNLWNAVGTGIIQQYAIAQLQDLTLTGKTAILTTVADPSGSFNKSLSPFSAHLTSSYTRSQV